MHKTTILILSFSIDSFLIEMYGSMDLCVILYIYGYNYLRSQFAYDVASGGLLASMTPRIWCPWGFLFDCIERPNELGFPYWVRSFRGKWIIYDKEPLPGSKKEYLGSPNN